MKISNIYIIFSVLILLLIGGMLMMGSRCKKEKKFSPLTGLSFAFIITGIFFGNDRMLGCGLLVVGIMLAVSDIIVKLKGSRRQTSCSASRGVEFGNKKGEVQK